MQRSKALIYARDGNLISNRLVPIEVTAFCKEDGKWRISGDPKWLHHQTVKRLDTGEKISFCPSFPLLMDDLGAFLIAEARNSAHEHSDGIKSTDCYKEKSVLIHRLLDEADKIYMEVQREQRESIACRVNQHKQNNVVNPACYAVPR
jgi:hypothetical protein